MRTLVRSAAAVVAFALSFASVSAMAVTAPTANVPVNCKNPLECSTKIAAAPVECKNPLECSTK
jgi:hypothetical protein